MSLFNRGNPVRKTGCHLYTPGDCSQFGKQHSKMQAKKMAPAAFAAGANN
jgi:hypothetical protein